MLKQLTTSFMGLIVAGRKYRVQTLPNKPGINQLITKLDHIGICKALDAPGRTCPQLYRDDKTGFLYAVSVVGDSQYPNLFWSFEPME